MLEVRVALIMFWLLLATATAEAGIPPRALNAYHAGHFLRAAQLAEAERSPPSLAFAAQALIADAITRPDGFCAPCLVQAETLTGRAASMHPGLIEAWLQHAIALGFRGRVIGLSEARAGNLAEKARDSLDHALALDPSNVWARASLGAWHLEIVHHAGPILAELSYGASRSQGLKLYREALADAPQNAILHFHFALSLLALDPDRLTPEAHSALEDAITVDTTDALTLFTQDQARQLLRALQENNEAATAALVRRFQGYKST